LCREREYEASRVRKIEQLSKEINPPAPTPGSFMSKRSIKLSNSARWQSLSEIYDVLLWSVAFTSSCDDDGVVDMSQLSENGMCCLSNPDERLDVSRALPQLLRPQDLANLVSLVFSKFPEGTKLTRREFVSAIENASPATVGYTDTGNGSSGGMSVSSAVDQKASAGPGYPLNMVLTGVKRSQSTGRRRTPSASDRNDCNHNDAKVMQLPAKRMSDKLASQGIHGERRKLGLSVENGLLACMFLTPMFALKIVNNLSLLPQVINCTKTNCKQRGKKQKTRSYVNARSSRL
jgi:hypothetical protein